MEAPSKELEEKTDQPSLQKALKTPEVDWEDYLAHKVAERAKKKVLGYFAVATVSISLLLTIYGISGLNKVLEDQFVKVVDERSSEAIEKIELRFEEFESELSKRRVEVKTRSEIYFASLAPSPESFRARPLAQGGRVDLSSMIGPILDQGAEPATVGCAITYAATAHLKNELDGKALSWWGLYKQVALPGAGGAYMHSAFAHASEHGIYAVEDWPVGSSGPKPGRTPFAQIQGWRRLDTSEHETIASILSAGSVVLAGVVVTKDFYSPGPEGRIGEVTSSQAIGGHVLTLVGYSEDTDEYRFANSWGQKWGDEGFGLIGVGAFEEIANEAYVVTGANLTPTQRAQHLSSPDTQETK